MAVVREWWIILVSAFVIYVGKICRKIYLHLQRQDELRSSGFSER